MARMFGTDGVRGVAGTELTIELAMKLGQAGAYVLTKEKAHQPTIIVGCDTRISGGMLANALMAGICSVGANAVYMGVMPTPAIAYLTKKHKVDAGVVISASHNPMEFNGIKFFNGEGYKLSDELEALLFCQEGGGLYHIHQQLQLRQLKGPAAQVEIEGLVLGAHNVQTEELQQL